MRPIQVCRFPSMEEMQCSITPKYPSAVTAEHDTKRKDAVASYRVYIFPNSRLERQSYISLTRFAERSFGRIDNERIEAEYHPEVRQLPQEFQSLVVQVCGGVKGGTPIGCSVSYNTSYSLTNYIAAAPLPGVMTERNVGTFSTMKTETSACPASVGFSPREVESRSSVPHSVGFFSSTVPSVPSAPCSGVYPETYSVSRPEPHHVSSTSIPLHQTSRSDDMEQLRQALLRTQQENIRLQRCLEETQRSFEDSRRALEKRNTEIIGVRQLLHSIVERLA